PSHFPFDCNNIHFKLQKVTKASNEGSARRIGLRKIFAINLIILSKVFLPCHIAPYLHHIREIEPCSSQHFPYILKRTPALSGEGVADNLTVLIHRRLTGNKHKVANHETRRKWKMRTRNTFADDYFLLKHNSFQFLDASPLCLNRCCY